MTALFKLALHNLMSQQADDCCADVFSYCWLSFVVVNVPFMLAHRNMTLPWLSGACSFVEASMLTF